MTKNPYLGKGFKMYNWDGVYYYFDQPCSDVSEIPQGSVVVDYYGDRTGSFDIYDNGYIKGSTITGKELLKINR